MNPDPWRTNTYLFKEPEEIFFFKDGTFETSPPPFADGQIVFIHAKLPNGRAMPAAFALLSRKVFLFISYIILIPPDRPSSLYPHFFYEGRRLFFA